MQYLKFDLKHYKIKESSEEYFINLKREYELKEIVVVQKNLNHS